MVALVGPQDFGIITIAMNYTEFLPIFLKQGLVAAWIEGRDFPPEHLYVGRFVWTSAPASSWAGSIMASRGWVGRNRRSVRSAVIAALTVCIPTSSVRTLRGASFRRERFLARASARTSAISSWATTRGPAIGVGQQ